MANIIKGTFTGNGDSEEFTASEFTFTLGNTASADYGDGTVTVYAKQADENAYTIVDQYTTTSGVSGQVVKSTEKYAGGLKSKLTLSGATDPNLPYTIKYINQGATWLVKKAKAKKENNSQQSIQGGQTVEEKFLNIVED